MSRTLRAFYRAIQAVPTHVVVAPFVAPDPNWRVRPDKAWTCPRCRVQWPCKVEKCTRCDGPCRPVRERASA